MLEKIELATDKWLGLNSFDELYFVESGELEIYVVGKNKYGADVRRFVGTAGAGDLVCGTGEAIKSAFIATKDASLVPADWEELFARGDFCRLFTKLALNFMKMPLKTLRPRVFSELELGREISIEKDVYVMGGKEEKLIWAELLSGEILEKERIFGGAFFLLDGNFVKTAAECTVNAFSTEEIYRLKDADFFKICLTVQIANMAAAYSEFLAAEDKFAEERLSLRRQEKNIIFQNAHIMLLKKLIPNLPFAERVSDKNQPDAIGALQQIGAYLGLKKSSIRLPQEYGGDDDIGEIVRLINGKNELFGRKVLLEEGWHRKDQGPLLVVRDGIVCAALPVSSDKYELVNPQSGIKTVIDNALAKEISDTGYSFYRSMPESVRDLKSWLMWASGLCWKRDYLLLLAVCLIVGFTPVITPLITQTVFSDIIPSYDKQAHLMVVQVMMVTTVAGAFTDLVRSISVMRIKNHICIISESSLWLKLLSLPTAFFRRYQVGDLTYKMQGISQISAQFSSVVSSGLFNGLFSFFNLVVMFYFSYKMAFLACFIWAVYLSFSALLSWQLLKYQREEMKASSATTGQVVQLLTGLSRFKARASEEQAFNLWAKKFGEEWHWNAKSRWQNTWLALLNQSQSIILSLSIYYLAMTLFDESMESGTMFLSQANFLSFNSAMGSFGSSVSGLLSGVMSIVAMLPHLEMLKPILEEKSETSEAKLPAGELSGNIDIYDVSFRYNPELPLVLKNISFNIKAGSFVAVVGSSGSGKSTLLRILLGMETAEKGVIQYDGLDLSQLDVTSVRRQIGVVMQQGKLMSGSIFNNIVGSLPLTQDDAWEAARLVGLDKDIRDMPMGLHTVISEGGGNISGGQKQRILIARAIANRPRIVVFDEATSALDNATQAIVSETLERMKATRVIIAHRLSTIRKADKIIVIDKGRIAESGGYDELIEKGGIFKTLVERQTL